MREIFLSLLFIIPMYSFAQDVESEALAHQSELNEQYADQMESPLAIDDRKDFKSLDFFAIDETYRVAAKFKFFKEPETLKMKTSGTRNAEYQIHAKVKFKLKGKKYKAVLFSSESMQQSEEYKDLLFFAFSDLTNGEETYGGGRYIDVFKPEGKLGYIDFNQSYHPYCAYNSEYSCVIPPIENFISQEIRAGIRYGENQGH